MEWIGGPDVMILCFDPCRRLQFENLRTNVGEFLKQLFRVCLCIVNIGLHGSTLLLGHHVERRPGPGAGWPPQLLFAYWMACRWRQMYSRRRSICLSCICCDPEQVQFLLLKPDDLRSVRTCCRARCRLTYWAWCGQRSRCSARFCMLQSWTRTVFLNIYSVKNASSLIIVQEVHT